MNQTPDLVEENERLISYIANMCALLEVQAPVSELDKWADNMTSRGLYTSERLKRNRTTTMDSIIMRGREVQKRILRDINDKV